MIFIKKCPKVLVVHKKVVPLHPQNRTREFYSKQHFGVWCNGNTADSGPAFPGSSPGTPTNKNANRLIIRRLAFSLPNFSRDFPVIMFL